MTPNHVFKNIIDCEEMFSFVENADEATHKAIREIFPAGYWSFEFLTNDTEDLIRVIEEIVGEGTVCRDGLIYALNTTADNALRDSPMYTWAYINLPANYATAIRMYFELEP